MSDPRQDAGAPAVPSSPETEAWSDSNPGSPSPSTSIARASVPEPPSAFATVYPPGTLGLAAGPAPNVPGFEILSELGHGGMGVVYKARHLKLNRLVALKMIRPGLHSGAEALARFRVEAEAVARLQHPGIVQVFEIGEYEGSPFFAMELVAGVSLDKLIAGDPVPARPAAALVHRLAEAIQAAHEKNVIHRDLKPANIILQESGARGQESEVRSQAGRNRLQPTPGA